MRPSNDRIKRRQTSNSIASSKEETDSNYHSLTGSEVGDSVPEPVTNSLTKPETHAELKADQTETLEKSSPANNTEMLGTVTNGSESSTPVNEPEFRLPSLPGSAPSSRQSSRQTARDQQSEVKEEGD